MTEINLAVAASMWNSGCDTLDIAKRLRLAESLVYVWLDEIKNVARKARAAA